VAFTATDLETVEAAIKAWASRGGVKRLTVGGKSVEYGPLSDLLDLRQLITADVYADEQMSKASLRYRG